MELEEMRKLINETDRKLVNLFTERMGLASLFAEYKMKHNLPVLNRERENDIIKKVRSSVPLEYADSFEELYKKIFEISRNYQEKLINKEK